jgi:LAO/AO transport system kinase
MGDTFLFLTLARMGDQLQGIKKGILEIADVIAVNKADDVGGVDRETEARSAARELAGALRLVYAGGSSWVPPVLTCSALEGRDVDTVWQRVLDHREFLGEQGLADKRAEQQLEFTWALVRDEIAERFRRSPGVAAVRDEVRAAVLSGELAAPVAADRLLAAYDD